MLLPERGNSLNPEAAGTSGAHVGQGWYRVVTGAVVQECISVMKIDGLPVTRREREDNGRGEGR
jgi:hypothetical protein